MVHRWAAASAIVLEFAPTRRRALAVMTACAIVSRWLAEAGEAVLELPSAATDYLISRWSSDDGLPQNSVISMAQTSDGYIWLSTFGGLARFDGLRFEVFDGDLVPGLAGEYFTTLRADRVGNLWLHGEHKGLVVGRNGRFRKLGAADGLLPAGVESLEVGSDGTVWVGDAKGRLSRFAGDRFVVVSEDPPGADWGRLGRIMPDYSGRVWAHLDTALAVFERGGWSLQSKTQRPCAVLPLRDGSVLQVSGPGCDVLQRVVDGRAAEIGRVPGGFTGHFVREDAEGNIWFTCASGVLRFAPDGRWTRLSPADGLMVDTVRSELTDREGNFWLGTDGGGLVRLKRRGVRSAGLAEGMSKRIALSVAGDGAGGLWTAVLTGGLDHFDGRRFTQMPGPLRADIGPLAWCVHPARDGGVWIGTYGDGLVHLDAARERLTRYTTATHPGMGGGPIFALLEEPTGVLWFGGKSGGLTRLADGAARSWSTTNGLVDNQINAIAADRSGVVWAGTPKGLQRVAGERLSTFTTADGLAHEHVRALFFDHEGTLWIGGRGVTRFKDGRFSPIRGTDGLLIEVVKSIQEDDLGNLWFSTPHGLLRGEKRMMDDFCDGRRTGVAFTVVDMADGLPSNECSGYQPAVWKNPDGKLYYPTLDGVAVVDPRHLPKNELPPPVVIESVRMDERSVPAGAGVLEVPPGTARVELRYTALSFTAPGRNRFRYRLAGFDPGWRDAGTERSAVYTRLPPRRYTFEVLGSNNDGVWSPEPASLAVTVLPAWWQTAWFQAGAGLAVCGAVAWAYRVRVRALTRARRVQEEFSRRLVASQEAERKRIAAELHDSLGQNLLVIKSRLALAQQQSGQPAKLAEQLDEAVATTSLAIREVRQISQNLRPFQLDELGLTRALAAMVRTLASASPIQFVCEVAELRGVFPPESEINLYRVAQECLNNVVKHSQATRCDVSVARADGSVRLVVADDGRGFATGAAAAGSTRAGFGLVGLAERVRMLGGQVDITARPGEGARVSVTVPLPP